MISLIAFLAVTAYMVIFINRYMVSMKSPLNKTKRLSLEGLEAFLVLVFATGTMSMSSSGGGHGAGTGFNLQAIRLLLLEVFCIWALVRSARPIRWGIGTIAYLVYMLWLLYSMTYSEAGAYGWRYILKYLYPICIMLCASSIVRDEEVFVSICVWARRGALASLALYFLPSVNRMLGGLFWYEAALNINYVSIIVISLALFFCYGRDWKDLALAILFVFPTIFQVHRTGLLGIFAAVAVFCFYKFRWISLPYIAGVLAIGLAIVFYVPAFHDKMFWKDSDKSLTITDLREGNIEEGDIRNNGREALWNLLEVNFYKGHELKGSGIGSCQRFLYEAGPGFVKQPHGDYVQIRCDTGQIGFWLWIIVLASILVHCFIVTVSAESPQYLKYSAMIAAAAVAGNFAAMYSENVVAYTMCTDGYAFGLYGVMLGLKAKLNETS